MNERPTLWCAYILVEQQHRSTSKWNTKSVGLDHCYEPSELHARSDDADWLCLWMTVIETASTETFSQDFFYFCFSREKCHHLVETKYKGFFCFKDTHFSYVSHFFRSFCPEHGEQTVFCVLCSTEDSALNRKPTFHVCEHHQLCSTATVTLWRVVCVSAGYACGSVKTHTNTCIGQNTRIAHTKRLRAREPTTTKTTNDAWRTTQNWWRV